MRNDININPLDIGHAYRLFYFTLDYLPDKIGIIGYMPSDTGFWRTVSHVNCYSIVGHVTKLFSKHTEHRQPDQKNTIYNQNDEKDAKKFHSTEIPATEE
jgi:hypothetical protein